MADIAIAARAAGARAAVWRNYVVFAVVIALTAWLLASFHDRFWWPPDDGAYAYIASRILAGDVLNRDVQDVHAGYVNFVNAGALALFGDNLVSLRYPLVALTILQTGIVFVLLLPAGIRIAVAGAAGMASLTFVQFLNPTAHWYALFVTVSILAALSWFPRGARGRLAAVGFLLVTLFMFRQLTGVFVAMGVLTYLLCAEPGTASRAGPRFFSRALLVVMALGLSGYLSSKADLGAALLFGLGPLALLIWGIVDGGRSNRETIAMVARLAVGGIVAAAPLVLYHAAHGSLASWFHDCFSAGITLVSLPFIAEQRYLNLIVLALHGVILSRDAVTIVNGLFWLTLTMLAFAGSALTLRSLLRGERTAIARIHALPIVASFYALVAIHYQIPMYLLCTVALSLAALLLLTTERESRARHYTVGIAAFLCATGLWFHAGQPLERRVSGAIAGQRAAALVESGLARADLRIGAEDAASYRALVALIQAETPEDAPILALPFNPELYYLSGRRAPTRFYISALGVPSEDALRDTLDRLRRTPPRLVFYRPDDKYNTPNAVEIMRFIRATYEPLPPLGGFEIYRYRRGDRSGQR